MNIEIYAHMAVYIQDLLLLQCPLQFSMTARHPVSMGSHMEELRMSF